jgi:hypothetical protein
MKLYVKSVLAVALLMAAADAGAQTAAISASIPPSGRANGMGEAFVAVVDDASAAWWNPGALGLLKKRDLSLSHAQLVPGLASDVYHDFMAYAQPIRHVGTLAFSLVYLSYGQTTGTGNVGEDLGTFNAYEILPAISYGFALPGGVGLGATFKYTRVQLAPDDILVQLGLPPGSGAGSTWAADLGFMWAPPVLSKRVSLGASLQNLGPDISFIDHNRSDPIYRNFKGGVGVKVYDHQGLTALVVGDINQLLVRGEIEARDDSGNVTVRRRYGKPIWNGGAEVAYTITNVAVALRGGYIQDTDGSISDPTFGMGLGYKGFRIDFASIPQASDPETGTKLDRVKKFTLGARF